MGILWTVIGIILFLLISVFLVLIFIFYAMIRGLIKKHPKADQAQEFIFRFQETHFSQKRKKQQSHD